MRERVFRIKNLLFSSIFILSGLCSYGQIATGGDKFPNPNADLTLGSENKGALLNRVKLVSANSAAPLNPAHLVPGMLVYNTNVTPELVEGYYFWTSEKIWNRFYVKIKPSQEMSFLGFKETISELKMANSVKNENLSELDFEFTAPATGTLVLDMTLYSSIYEMKEKNITIASNTFFYTKVTNESTKKVIFTGVTAISPYVVVEDKAGYPVQGFSSFATAVQEGTKYKITTSVEDYYVGDQGKVSVGSLKFKVNNVDTSFKSNMRVSFLAAASM